MFVKVKKNNCVCVSQRRFSFNDFIWHVIFRSRSLKRVFLAKNISTVGQLSKLTETEIQSLPIRSPKVKVVFQALASVIKTSAELSDKGKGVSLLFLKFNWYIILLFGFFACYF